MNIPVSLIVPTYGRPTKLMQLLSSLTDCEFSCQLIIIDDCSPLPVSEQLIEYKEILNFELIRNERNSGPAFSRNRGIKRAKHEMVAFMDDDCIVSSDWLYRLYEYLRDSPRNVVGVGGRTLAYRNNLVGKYCEYHKILDPWFHNGRCLYLVTANCIFRKSPLIEVGGFDEDIRRAGGEDVGLCFKLISKGYELLYNPDAIIYHDFNPSIRTFWRTFKNYGKGCRIQHEQHFKDLHYLKSGFGGKVEEGNLE